MSNKSFGKTRYIDSARGDAAAQVGAYLAEMLGEFTLEPVFVCIGSDRVTGDSLGPMVGSWLKKKYRNHLMVYGTLEMPVHALNLNDIMSDIQFLHKDHPIIAVDASLGTKDHLGYITIGRGSLAPGAGVNKCLSEVGDIFITGIVGTAGRFSHLTLQTARLSGVIRIAEQIYNGIYYACGERLAECSRDSAYVAAAK